MLRSALAILLFVALPAPLLAQVQYVQPIDWSRFSTNGAAASDPFGVKLTGILQNESKYLYSWINTNYTPDTVDNTWVSSSAIALGANERLCYYPNWSYSEEANIRTLAHFSLGTATMLQTGAYSPSVTGISVADAYSRTEMAIRGAVFTHDYYKINSLDWGNDWQTAYWAAQIGEAGWMIWDHLSPSTQQAVAKVVEVEANRFLNYQVPYWANPNGSINTPGDTKAEENAWNSRILTVAQAMMPNHPNAAQWRTKSSELMVSAYSRPSDLTNTKLVDGKPVEDWVNGYNTYENGVLVNHNFVHPDYLNADILRYTTTIDTSLAKQYIPESTFFNADVVYGALTTVQFSPGASTYGSGSIAAPGGTVYTTSTVNGSLAYNPNLYYPQGTDWSNVRYDDVSLMDLYAEFQGLDLGKSYDAMGWAQARVDAIAALQARVGHTGNTYQPGDWITDWRPKEAFLLQSLSEEWMLWWLMGQDAVSPVADHWGALPVPEPHSIALFAIGACSVLLYRRTSRRGRISRA